MKTVDLEAHWECIYSRKQVEKLGWFEQNPLPSLKLISRCNLNQDSSILNVGSGATRLVDELLALGYSNIIVNDLSGEALEKLKSLEPVNLWHDRAVLHFFTHHQEQLGPDFILQAVWQ